MNSEAIDLIIERKPNLKRSRAKLEAMKPGAYCMHRSWGFGNIKDYDPVDNKLIIDFEDGKLGHRMDPAFCVDKLEILEEKNILVRRRTEPTLIEELIKKRPADLIVEILTHCPNQTASPAELEGLLMRLLGPTKFKKWWNSAKKVLAKDPRVATPNRKTEPYILRDEPVKPEQEILEDFYLIKQPKKKIVLAEKIYEICENVEEIAEDLPNILEHLTTAIQDARQLSQAERLHGIWVRNNLARHLHEDPENIKPTSRELVLETEDLNVLAAEIPAAYNNRFLDLLTRIYPDDWKNVILDVLRNSSGKMTTEAISFLCERECKQLVADSLGRWLDEQSIKGPVLLWIVKNRNSKKYSGLIEGLINPRTLSAIFYAIDYEALQTVGNRRIPLGDLLIDDRPLIKDLLADASEEEAHDLAQSLLLNQGFENLSKKSLLARFIKLYPSIQSLVSGEAEKKVDKLIVSQKSLDERKAEYDDLINNKIPENKKAIVIAREHGDLRENAEYKMARQDQDTLLARKDRLESEFASAQVTDFNDVNSKTVGVGSVVELAEEGSKKSQRYAILGAWDGEPERNILSYKTPLGQALLGKSMGDVATTEIDGNKQNWKIAKIERWLDVSDKF